MAKGLPKSIIKKYGISKKAWRVFRGRKGKTRSRKTRASNPKKRRKTKLGRRKRGRRRNSMTIPLAPIIGLAAGMADPIQAAMAGNFDTAIEHLKYRYLGITPGGQFNAAALSEGLLPLVIGLLVHKFVGGPPLNFNAMLVRAKVPFIRT